MLNHILVPLDQSELAEKALEYARQIVAADGKITCLTVIDMPSVPYMFAPEPYAVPIETSAEEYENLKKSLRAEAQTYLQKIVENLKPLSAEAYIEFGNPAETIVDTAEKMNVKAIVMSTHGRSGLSRWVFGSVTQKVLNAAPCPVMVVPKD